MDAANINKTDGNGSKEDASSSEALERASAFTYYFASTFLSAAKIVFKQKPKKPPDGAVKAFLVLIATLGIFAVLTILGLVRIVLASLRPTPKRKKKRRKRSAMAMHRHRLKRLSKRLSALPFLDCTEPNDETFFDAAASEGDPTMPASEEFRKLLS